MMRTQSKSTKDFKWGIQIWKSRLHMCVAFLFNSFEIEVASSNLLLMCNYLDDEIPEWQAPFANTQPVRVPREQPGQAERDTLSHTVMPSGSHLFVSSLTRETPPAPAPQQAPFHPFSATTFCPSSGHPSRPGLSRLHPTQTRDNFGCNDSEGLKSSNNKTLASRSKQCSKVEIHLKVSR
jgi:hypothetical protein